MICQTVMLTCAFQLGLIELPYPGTSEQQAAGSGGSEPDTFWKTLSWVRNSGILSSVVFWGGLRARVSERQMYSAALGSALGMLSLSLWFNFIVTRRLNQYTAGVMHVEMNLDAKWRKKRGVDDVLDAALLRDYFRKWFNTHCAFLADVSQLSFAFGVITLFFAASILTHMRFELKNEIHGAAAPFFTVITLASLGILIIEAQERRLGKQKRGVYAARPAPPLSRAHQPVRCG